MGATVHPALPTPAAPPEAFAGASVVVHAAAASSGGYREHERNTIEATGHVLRAMHRAGCARLLYVSSLSALRPPRKLRERQDENTPLASPSCRELGPYTWGKTAAEHLVSTEAPRLGIAIRVLRPGALVDYRAPEVPGLLGRRLFGRWHLGLGRPGLPFAACEVGQAATAVAWCAEHFDQAPPAANLLDPRITTRAQLLRAFRAHGWSGRMLWLPISVFAGLVTAARVGLGITAGRLPARLKVWSIFRPRRYDPSVGARLLAAATAEAAGSVFPVPSERRVPW